MTDRALEWMSYRRSGKIGDLPGQLIGTANERRFVDDAVTLGHAEWTAPNAWQIAPPVLAGLPRNGRIAAALCGARTPKLLDALTAACSAAGTHLSAERNGDRPATVMVVASSQELLADTAARAGIPLQTEAAIRILACTPSVRLWPRTPCPMVQGRVETVRRFSRSKMHWVSSTLAEAAAASAGFFRIQRDWDWVSLIKSSPQDAALIDDRAGRMAAAAKCKVVRWAPDSGTLSLPAQLYPPGIMARGMALCSGGLPRFDRETRQIEFAGVRPEHLRLFLALTGLRLI
ncbi:MULTISPECIES: hypothetical protein [Bradyrhizobium]|uniref:hypothetical protein n=1 Tax=Bradyrhizobium TaxID=374 RepID=UPI002225DEBA|nr:MULTISPECIES: hypothetical protein [Bradyrhizobium]MCW2359809.1 hypothetical protein [Bradyrhizobium elkanii]MDI2052964.1 hypothetical protein [Bradyrhizobium sp. Mp19]